MSSPVRSTPRARSATPAVALLLAVSLAAWQLVYDKVVWVNDDLIFASRQQLPFGQMRWGLWLHTLWNDYAHRNGRLADAFLELALRHGFRAGQVLLGLTAWAFCLAAYLWCDLLAGRRERSTVGRLLLVLGAMGLPLALAACDWHFGNEMMWFMAAAFGYLGGAALLMLGTLPLLAVGLGRRVPWPVVVVGTLVACFACLFHEAAANVATGLAVAVLLLGRRLHRRLDVVVGWALVAIVSLGRFTAGGLWARQRNNYSGSGLAGGPGVIVSHMTTDLVNFQREMRPLLVVVFLCLALWFALGPADSPHTGARRRRSAVAVLVGPVLWCLAGQAALAATLRTSSVLPAVRLVAVLGAVASMVVPIVLLLRLTARRGQAMTLLLPWCGASAAFPLPLLVVDQTGRFYFYSVAMMALTALLALVGSVDGVLAGRASEEPGVLVLPSAVELVTLVLLAAFFPVAGALGWVQEYPRLEANDAAWQQAERALVHDQKVPASRAEVVRLPDEMPCHNDAQKTSGAWWPGGRPRVVKSLAMLYGLDPSVRMAWVRAADCPGG